MELSNNFVQIIQDLILQPSSANIVTFFTSSLVNELFPVSPYSIILSSQLLFLEGSFSTIMLTKLFIFVSIPVGIGAAIGSVPAYGLAYLGGKPAIEKFGKYVRLSWADVERAESRFAGSWYDEILFLVIRSIPLVPYLPTSVAAGIIRMHLVPYVILTSLGATIRMIIMFMIVGFGVEALAQ